ncbi:random slug 5-like [Chlorella sorokiniana]|jgi:polyribonucleotide 5'-hydroxyl-kinase|uniref:Random slug 5-like n=1 Tax=Chlorella sorokiniana TaxID=3076 RepID=A0A2P6U387_CHLSO|nr:random slug 5-like [Chlorella sorokiniana]|eukprot:PRW60765.1 random slug 5-like [Chlorella sorokiniana]
MATSQPWYEAPLEAEEEKKVAALTAAVAAVVNESAALRAFCTRGTYIRYLRARHWNVKKATKMLLETLRWRTEYRPEALDYEAIKHEGARGKLFVLDHPDNDGRPVVIMRPRLEAVYSGDSDERVKWLVYTLEQASRIADATAADGKMTWLIDFVGYNSKNSPPIKVSLQVLHILQNHFPERLGRAVSYKPPMLFNILWRAVSPFVDPHTREKLVFLSPSSPPEALAKHFNPQHIDDSLGGQIPVAQLWQQDKYAQRMKVLDAEAAAGLAAAAAAEPLPVAKISGNPHLPADSALSLDEEGEGASAESRRPTAEEEALNADFEKNVVIM